MDMLTGKIILVTGGSGYLASWIIHDLLNRGARVHTTVRDLSDTNKYQHLLDLADKKNGQLEIFEADLLKRYSFLRAMEGCDYVIHTASPFFISNIENPGEELIQPALEGTRNILHSVERIQSVKRVVLTSSVAAIFSDNIDLTYTAGGVFTEEIWNHTSNSKYNAYSYSKTLAEKEAWSLVKKQKRWDLVTINPGFIFGPSLTRRIDSTSIKTMIELSDGTYRMGAAELMFGLVDVRDVSLAHVQALLKTKAKGRYILVNETGTFLDMANILRKHFKNGYSFPTFNAPKFLVRIMAPLVHGIPMRFVNNNVGYPVKFDNTRSRRDLEIDYTPIEKTLVDQFQQLIDDKIVT